MVQLENSVIARMKVKGELFEIRVDPDLASDFKAGKPVSFSNVLAVDKIFADVRKGTEASRQKLKDAFGTDNVEDVAKQIIQKGELQSTAKQKDNAREQKVRQIITMIHRNAVDPQTKAPHPITRIEAAIKQANIKIDENKDVQSQIQDIIKKLMPILPIKFEIDEIEVKMSADFGRKAIPIVKQFGTIIKEQWQDDGSWKCIIEIPAGLRDDFFDRLNSLTHGDVETKILKTR